MKNKTRYLPLSPSELPPLAALSPLPPALQLPKVFTYDTTVFPFLELVSDVLQLDALTLPTLHLTKGGAAVLDDEQAGAFHRRRSKQPHYSRLWISSKKGEARRRFDQLLDTFVEIFIARHMGEEEEKTEMARVAYQREPNLRVVLPSGKPYGYLHCDADYHHPPAEVNWWLPLTPVSGTNTLYIETKPGLGDFHAVELEYGQVLRFYGNLCQHHTLPNTSDRTRVSLDLRVLSLAHHQPWKDRLGRDCLFAVGSYYARPGHSSPADVEDDWEEENLTDYDHLFEDTSL